MPDSEYELVVSIVKKQSPTDAATFSWSVPDGCAKPTVFGEHLTGVRLDDLKSETIGRLVGRLISQTITGSSKQCPP